MKRILHISAIVASLAAASLPLRSQDPAAAPAAPAVVATGEIPAGTPLERLKAIRDDNAKLLEQQAAALQKLDDLEKASQRIKILGKRS